MDYKIVELEGLSGIRAGIYSIVPKGQEQTLFETFVTLHKAEYKTEIDDFLTRLYQMGHSVGARESFFKLHEGRPGDFICALYDRPGKRLRLYCIRYGATAIILGGGAPKPPGIRAWQDDENLRTAVETLMVYAEDIGRRIEQKEIGWSKDHTRLVGNLNIEDDDC